MDWKDKYEQALVECDREEDLIQKLFPQHGRLHVRLAPATIRLQCRTCKSDLHLVGSSDIDKTLVPQPDGNFELDTSEWSCDCFDDDGNCLVNEDQAQDHIVVLVTPVEDEVN